MHVKVKGLLLNIKKGFWGGVCCLTACLIKDGSRLSNFNNHISKVKLLQIATWIRYGLFKYRSVLKLREYNSAMTQVML